MSTRNIIHIEIPTLNSQRSADFYAQLFGWKITREEGLDYTMFEPDAAPAGGFSKIPEEAAVGEINIFVESPDIEADLKEVERLGGKIVSQKTEIPGVGWFGQFTDPTGNKISLYTSKKLYKRQRKSQFWHDIVTFFFVCFDYQKSLRYT